MHSELDELPIEIDQGELITRYVEWGEMALRVAQLPAGTDMGPVLEGLPGDRCPSPHWGLVLEGRLTLVHADGTEETTCAGQVYHWPAGHTAVAEEPTVFIEVGPVAEMRRFGEHAQARFGWHPVAR